MSDILPGTVSAETSPNTDPRGAFPPSDRNGIAGAPHTASGTVAPLPHTVQRVLAVTLHLDDPTYQRLRDLSWQAARYRNLYLRAQWAELVGLCVHPDKGDAHDVTKWIRHDEKRELSGAAYSAAEREVAAIWRRHKRRVLAGAPLPEWKPTASLAIRGHKERAFSGVRLELDDHGHFVAHLQAQAATCPGGSWLLCPLAHGMHKDHQADLLTAMARWEVPISKASIQIKPARHKAILRLTYAKTIPLEPTGQRVATLGPIDGHRLRLRTELETRDYSGRLHTVLTRKDQWDAIRRRAMLQIGRRKGAARRKRQLLTRLSWEDWLTTFLHQWSHELIHWLTTRGVGHLRLVGLEGADWAAFRFTQLLTYKGEDAGIYVTTEADLEDPTVQRAVKQEIQHRQKRTRKRADALRELTHQLGDVE